MQRNGSAGRLLFFVHLTKWQAPCVTPLVVGVCSRALPLAKGDNPQIGRARPGVRLAATLRAWWRLPGLFLYRFRSRSSRYRMVGLALTNVNLGLPLRNCLRASSSSIHSPLNKSAGYILASLAKIGSGCAFAVPN